MTANTVEQWLSEALGLDSSTLGTQAVADAVQQRMAACGLAEESDYLKRLSAAPAGSPEPDELLALIEMIVVPETWFFRDREPFVFLEQFAGSTWPAAHPHGLLQVLSVPCSSGEEPYSIAIALQSAGLRPPRYRIDAMDINPALLRKAETGVYGPNSFRGGLPAHYERYFKLEGAARIVAPEVRAGIRFICGNIMGAPVLAAAQAYDIIFCRNLLIYQHAQAREHIAAALDRLLKPAGVLFVGHAEMIPMLTRRFEPVRHRGAFAYCKIKNANLQSSQTCSDLIKSKHPETMKMVGPDCQSGRREGTARPRPWRGKQAVYQARSVVAPYPSNFQDRARVMSPGSRVQSGSAAIPLHKSSLAPESRLDCIRVLADRGRLDEAAAMCRELLTEKPQLAEAHFLMGVIRAAEGQMEAAEECLNRALYLDADCYDALIHLSLLKARRGDEAAAGRLRAHAERVRDRNKVTT